MTEQIEMPEEFTAPRGVGPQLRLAREKLGLSVKQMADRTRIPQRHIETIEAGNFGDLPGRAYAVGFVRTLARDSELDPEAMVARLREELDSMGPDFRERRETYEPGDPSRAPSQRLIWLSVVAAAILLLGLFMAYRVLFSPAAELPPLVAEEAQVPTPAPIAGQAQVAGAVTLTAQGAVWLRVTDATGARLMEGELAAGDSYTVPAEADGPRIITGRPDLLAVTVGGRAVPPLSTEPVTVSNVPIDAASLLARTQAPQPSASASPVAPAGVVRRQTVASVPATAAQPAPEPAATVEPLLPPEAEADAAAQ